tara:strand:+ start:643 stop:1029 length:387 start_codon:yes stop_codon:yes gene_type:complete
LAKAKITHLHVDFVYLGVDLLPLVSDLLGELVGGAKVLHGVNALPLVSDRLGVLLDGAQVLLGLLQLGNLVEGLGEEVLADGKHFSVLHGVVPTAGNLLQRAGAESIPASPLIFSYSGGGAGVRVSAI